MAKPAISGARYMTEPTERSMPAVSRTKVMPMAAMPMKAACLTMLARLSGERKPGACRPNQSEDGDEDEQGRVAEEDRHARARPVELRIRLMLLT